MSPRSRVTALGVELQIGVTDSMEFVSRGRVSGGDVGQTRRGGPDARELGDGLGFDRSPFVDGPAIFQLARTFGAAIPTSTRSTTGEEKVMALA